MPSRRMTDEEKKRATVKRKVNRFMKNVVDFIESKNNGSVPMEWMGMLDMLEDYYKQYCNASWEIERMSSYTTDSRYGPVIHPIFKLQATAAGKVQALCGEFGLSMKQAAKLKVKSPEKEKSILDTFFEGEIERR